MTYPTPTPRTLDPVDRLDDILLRLRFLSSLLSAWNTDECPPDALDLAGVALIVDEIAQRADTLREPLLR